MKANTTLLWIVAIQGTMFIGADVISVGIAWIAIHFALKYW
jgi:hypothetical protein